MNPIVQWYERAKSRTDRSTLAQELGKMMLDAESPALRVLLLDMAAELGLTV